MEDYLSEAFTNLGWAMLTNVADKNCKLCGGQLRYRFSLALIGGLEGDYYECKRCSMLQSCHLDGISPEKLVQIYTTQSNPDLDTGAAWRQYCVIRRIENLFKYRVIRPRTGSLKVLDIGAGSGFVASYFAFHLGWDAYSYDPFSVPLYSPKRFFRDWASVEQKGPFDFIIASEVFEHLVQPKQVIRRIRESLSDTTAYIYITTKLYVPELVDEKWPYLAPQSGQHVCFYSRKSIEHIGRLFGNFDVYQVGGDYEWLFIRGYPSNPLMRKIYTSFATKIFSLSVKHGISRKIE